MSLTYQLHESILFAQDWREDYLCGSHLDGEANPNDVSPIEYPIRQFAVTRLHS